MPVAVDPTGSVMFHQPIPPPSTSSPPEATNKSSIRPTAAATQQPTAEQSSNRLSPLAAPGPPASASPTTLATGGWFQATVAAPRSQGSVAVVNGRRSAAVSPVSTSSPHSPTASKGCKAVNSQGQWVRAGNGEGDLLDALLEAREALQADRARAKAAQQESAAEIVRLKQKVSVLQAAQSKCRCAVLYAVLLYVPSVYYIHAVSLLLHGAIPSSTAPLNLVPSNTRCICCTHPIG